MIKLDYLHRDKMRLFYPRLMSLLDHTMRILVANDDGIYSPGLVALAKVASRFGEVRIVAPDVEQ